MIIYLAIYAMVYVALFLHSIWRCGLLGKVLAKTVQLSLVTFAFFVALSRVSDNKHHPTDVLAGSLIGIAVALVTYSFHVRFLKGYNYSIGEYQSVEQKEQETLGRAISLDNKNSMNTRV